MKLVVFNRKAEPYYRSGLYATRPLRYIAAGVAPHALTERATAVITSGLRIIPEYINIQLRRVTAATTVGLVEVQLTIRPLSTDLLIYSSGFGSNVVNDVLNITVPLGAHLDNGGTIKLKTSDSSTGGTVDYSIVAYFVEYSNV